MKKVRHIYQRVHEQVFQTDYEFMTEADMKAAGFSECLV